MARSTCDPERVRPVRRTGGAKKARAGRGRLKGADELPEERFGDTGKGEVAVLGRTGHAMERKGARESITRA